MKTQNKKCGKGRLLTQEKAKHGMNWQMYLQTGAEVSYGFGET